jgi:hypothetical protein
MAIHSEVVLQEASDTNLTLLLRGQAEELTTQAQPNLINKRTLCQSSAFVKDVRRDGQVGHGEGHAEGLIN